MPALARALPSFLFACIATLASAQAAVAQEASWPMAGGDAEHTATGEGPEPPYTVAWEQELGLGGAISGAVVAEGIVVAVAREAVTALEADTGEQIWTEDRAPGPAAAPAVSEDLVLHAGGDGSAAQLVARDLATGDIAWKAPLGAAAMGGPTVAGTTAIVGTAQGEVIALEVGSGEELWRFEAAGSVRSAPAVADDVVVVSSYSAGTATPTIYGLDLAGADRALWRAQPGAVGPVSSAAISDGLAIFGATDLDVTAVDLEEGTARWVGDSRDGFGPRQIPAAGTALVVADRTHLQRLDPATGDEIWTFRLADLLAVGSGVNTLLASSPALTPRAAVIGSTDGVLSAIDLESGRRVWSRDLGEGAVGPVALDGARVYATLLGERGKIVALEHDPDGTLLSEVSETVLFPLEAVLNFALAALAVGAAVLLLFRVVLRGSSK